MKQPEQIEHKGVVRSVEQGVVRVAIVVNEACGSCASRKACSMGQSEKREITVYTADACNYTVGEQVEVGAKQSLGVVAVLLCYVVPLVVLVASLATTIGCGVTEGVSVTHPGITQTNITAHYPRLIYAIIKYPMRVIFMRPRKACLSTLCGLFADPTENEWIGPRVLDIWGLPKISRLDSCSKSEIMLIRERAEKIYTDMYL